MIVNVQVIYLENVVYHKKQPAFFNKESIQEIYWKFIVSLIFFRFSIVQLMAHDNFKNWWKKMFHPIRVFVMLASSNNSLSFTIASNHDDFLTEAKRFRRFQFGFSSQDLFLLPQVVGHRDYILCLVIFFIISLTFSSMIF